MKGNFSSIWRVVIALVLTLSMVLVMAAPAMAATATATFAPLSGPVGTTITVTGTGWVTSETITSVTVGSNTTATHTLTVSASGILAGTITVPTLTVGHKAIVIYGDGSGPVTFVSAFYVTTAPVATSNTVTAIEDTTFTFASGNFTFTDAESDSLTQVEITTLPGKGTLKLSGADVTAGQKIAVADIGNLAYDPAANENGSPYTTFTFKVEAGADSWSANAATMTINVTAVNDNPDAVNDSATVLEDSGANTISVLGNDTCLPDVGETLTITGVTQGANGTVAITDAGGNVTYTPAANYYGSDSFTYTISDGNGGTDTATVTVTVTNVNDNPDAVNDSATVLEDSGANTISVLGNDTCLPDVGETLTITGVTQGANGTVAITDAGGNVTYTPAANYYGSDSFTYTISDGNGGTDTATVTVTVTNVNDNPDAVDDAATVVEDSGANTINVLGNDTCLPDVGETLTITGVTQGANGTVAITDAGGNVTYTPAANYYGSDSFTYTISDGNGGTDTATVTVTVTNVNDNPDAVNDSATVLEDSGANTISVLGNDTCLPDVGETLTITGVTQGANGTVAITDAGGNVTYTPAANYYGSDSFTYTISDGNGGTDTATVTVTVTNVNDNPDAVDDAATVVEDSGANTINVLGNDTCLPDVGETLTITGVTQGANGTVAITDAGGNVTYTPAANYYGSDSFTYTISDGNGGTDTATVTVTVTNVNDNPDAVNDSATVLEDSGANTISVLGNDTCLPDVGETLTITGVTQGANGTVAITDAGGNVTYTPAANYYGSDSFTYTISDGNGGTDTATVTVTVTNVNDNPDAVNDSATVLEDSGANTISVLGNDTCLPDVGETLTITGVTQGANGTVAITDAGGNVTYTPAANYYGSDSFTYTISDGNGGTDTATVTVTVTNVNDNPDAVNDSATVLEDSGANTISVLGNDTCLPDVGETLTITGVTQGANGTVAITDAGGNVTYTPAANYYGSDSFTYTISDGNGGTDTATVTVTVTNVNDNPDAVNDSATVLEDSGANTISVLGNDTCLPDVGETLTITGVTQGANGTVAITDAGGNVTYTPAANYYGSDSFTYTISDGNGGTDTATVTVTVTNVNDNPDAVNDSATVLEDSGANTISVLGNDTYLPDPLETLTITGVTQGTYGTVAIAVGNLTLTYTPNANYVGNDSFTYTISDGNGGADTATVEITVTNVNDNPVLAAIGNKTVTEEALLSFTATATDIDVPAQTLTFTLTGTVPDGAAITSDGNFTWTPAEDQGGADYTFNVVVSDGSLTDSETITVTVTIATAIFAPVRGPAGTTVTVTGTGWMASDAIAAGNVTVGGVTATHTLTVNAAGNLTGTITVPAIAAGLKNIGITGNTSGNKTFTNAFTVTTATATFTPPTGPSGTVLTVTGTGWTASDIITAGNVTVGGVTATHTLTVNAAGNLTGTITVPAALEHSLGLKIIVITGNTSGAQTFEDAFTVTALTTIALDEGWNFISVPKRMAPSKDTFGELLAGIEVEIAYSYDPVAGWSVLLGNSTVVPLDGYWVLVSAEGTITLSYAQQGQTVPPSKVLKGQAWNAIGHSSTGNQTAGNTLKSIEGSWSTLLGWDAEAQAYQDAIFAPGTGASDLMFPGKGYWIWITQDDTLSAISN